MILSCWKSIKPEEVKSTDEGKLFKVLSVNEVKKGSFALAMLPLSNIHEPDKMATP